jgi:plastocyanin
MTTRLAAIALAVTLGGAACSGSKPGVTVEMVNFTYKPVHVSIAAGDAVAFHNGTGTLHNFTLLRGGSVSFDVAAGDSHTTSELGDLKAGTYPFRCKYHFAQGMIGVLTVSAASS